MKRKPSKETNSDNNAKINPENDVEKSKINVISELINTPEEIICDREVEKVQESDTTGLNEVLNENSKGLLVEENVSSDNSTASQRLRNTTSFNSAISDMTDMSNDNADEEIALIRQLLQAEASADACDLLEAQDKFLESKIVSDPDTKVNEATLETSRKAKEARKNMVAANATFKTQTAASLFGEETFSKAVINSPKILKKKQTKEKYDFSVVKIPIKNLDKQTTDSLKVDLDDESSTVDDIELGTIKVKVDEKEGLDSSVLDSFFGTFEESEVINSFLETLDDTKFQLIMDKDELFADGFKTWCTMCLRNRRYAYSKAIELLDLYVAYRVSNQKFADLSSQSEISKALSVTANTTRDNASAVTVDDLDKNIVSYMSDSVDEKKNIVLDLIRKQLESGCILYIENSTCKENRGLIVIRLFLFDSKAFTEEDLIFCLHSVIVTAQKHEPKLQSKGFTVILDLSTRNDNTPSIKLIEKIVSALNGYLPLYLGKVLIYNPYLSFSAVYKMGSIYFTTKLKQKMKRVFPKRSVKPEYLNLFEHVTQENLPHFYSGSKQINTLTFAMNVLTSITQV